MLARRSARLLVAAALLGLAQSAAADSLDDQFAQCDAADRRIRQLEGDLRYTPTGQRLAAMRNAYARLPAMQAEAQEVEQRAGCFNLTSKCRAALKRATDLEAEARSLAFDLLGHTGTVGGNPRPSEKILDITLQFERTIPPTEESYDRRRVFEAELVAQRALYEAIDCKGVFERHLQREVQKARDEVRAASERAATYPPAMPSDPFDEGRALVDAGAAAVPAAGIRAADLVGAWIANGYQCDGPQGEEIIAITLAPDGRLIAKKIIGDDCVRRGEVTWQGTLVGNTITGEFHAREPGAADGDDSWVTGSFTVRSRDEIEGFGLQMRRNPYDRPVPGVRYRS